MAMSKDGRPSKGRASGAGDGGPESLSWGGRSAASLQAGDIVGGHYVIEGPLDEGGMAVVYQARNAATGKPCALKVLQAQLSARPEFIQLFAKEAKVGSLIGDHKHIVTVYDAGLDEERRLPFIVMELLDGETLERVLERGALSRDVACQVFEQLGDALEQAHRAGVVHRDLKPGNVFLTRDSDGEPLVKVMDFGIAKVIEGEVLRTATQIGTPAYTAPEQMGATTRKIAARQGITIAGGVTPATDVWALGLLAYEIFTGLPPGHYWGAETLSELPMKVAFEELEPATVRAGRAASRLPDGFDEWFDHCLQKNAEDRYAAAGEAVRELLKLFGWAPAPPPLPRESKRHVMAELIDEDEDALATQMAPSERTRPSRSSKPAPSLPKASAPTITVAARPAGDTEVPLEGASDTTDAPVTMSARRGSIKPAIEARRRPPPPSTGKYVPAIAGLVAVGVAIAGWYAYGRQGQGDGAKMCLDAQNQDREAVLRACDQACAQGSLTSCGQLARSYESGDGVKADAARARELYAKACGVTELPSGKGASPDGARRWIEGVEKEGCSEKNCVESACAALASYYEDGRGGLQSNERAATALFKRVCSVDFADDETPRGVTGCVGLGEQREHAGQNDAARNYYNAACTGNVLDGCVGLAGLLERGDNRGQNRDEKKARELYQRACDGSALKGCTQLGRMVERGRGGWVKDEPAAVNLYKRACDGGELTGCTALASAYKTGRGGLPQDAVRAGELFSSSCDGRELRACALLANMTQWGEANVKRDEKRAYGLNQQACDGGSLLGCANLGKMYIDGSAGLTKDEAEGAKLIEKACNGGEPVGCLYLAHIEAKRGKLLPHELEALFQNACNDGEPRACVGLGEILEAGKNGLEQDLTRAAQLYTRACEEGAMRGCTHLANLTYQGVGGLEKDPQKSLDLNDKACRGGDQVGCARLGLLYALGHGVTKNPSRAGELYKDGCSNKGPDWDESMQQRCDNLRSLIAAPPEEEEEKPKAPAPKAPAPKAPGSAAPKAPAPAPKPATP
ncbi:MAG TPA: protein kinase [Polyangiaceae bacterium]|nr:protein kinase [Polyangiaceae bacterium]